MKKVSAEKIKGIVEDRENAHNELIKRGSKVYESFLKMAEYASSDGNLSKKVKELIAIGISVVINCESCMEWHIKQALDSGAQEEEIIEAIEVGIEMGGGPATASSRFALGVLEYYRGK